MKFDKIIMNPPYSKNLHLKILAKAIEKLDENGTCVNLSPIRWLQDPYNQFKKITDITRFNASILNHLNSVEVIAQKTTNACFNIGLYVNLGVYVAKHTSNKSNSYKNFWKNEFNETELSIFNKISNHTQHLADVIEHNKRDGIRVLIALIGGNRGMLPIYKDIAYAVDGMKDDKDWTKCKNNGGYEKQECSGIPNSIKFNSEKEAQNFYDSYKTGLAKFICNHYVTDQHIPDYWLPWMGDCINPRTGKKGYESEWTDEDFYAYFGITEDEQKLIEETMEKYK